MLYGASCAYEVPLRGITHGMTEIRSDMYIGAWPGYSGPSA